MSALLDRIRRMAQLRPQRLVLPEGEDERIVGAAERLRRDGLAAVTLVGPPERVRAIARRANAALTGIPVIDPAAPAEVERTARAIQEARGERLKPGEVEKYSRDPLFLAATRVREGDADLFVGGATRATADVLRAALWLIGLAPGVKTVASFFLMVVPPGPAGSTERVLVFADCAVVPDPSPEQLAEIGCLAADAYQSLMQQVPHTAFLSFATRGSAQHPCVDKVRAAVAQARARRHDLHFDGELQLDAALVPEVARRKAPDSVVAGQANVLVFPDLNAGNIGYKLVERLAGARALGPILMGLARPANDLSRGCSVEDVIGVATIAGALSGAAASAARR